MRTTLDLPDPLFKEVKTRAVQQGVTLKELLATYIEAGLRAPLAAARGSASEPDPYPIPVAIRRRRGAARHPALTNAGMQAILDEEDVEKHRRLIAQSRKAN